MGVDQHIGQTVDADRWASFCGRFIDNPHRVAYMEAVIVNVNTLNSLVAEAMTAITSSFDRHQPRRVRVFRENALDYGYTERLIFDGYSGSAPLDWLNYLGEQERLCVAVNDLDAWGPGLAETCAAELIPSFSNHLEHNSLVLDWYGFVSTAGWTPFGIHADDEPSLLLNLGPGDKLAWIWDPEVLPRLSRGRPTSLHFDSLLRDANTYTLRPGDAIMIPAGHFHVLKSESPCTILGAGFYPASYVGELAAFLRSKVEQSDSIEQARASDIAELLPTYLDLGEHRTTSDSLRRYLGFLKAKVKSQSFSRRSRYFSSTPEIDDFDIQEFIVTRHPIATVAERVILSNGKAIAVPTITVNGVDLQVWLTQHPRFHGRDYLALFAEGESEQARQIANQLLHQGNLRLSGDCDA